MTRWSEGFAKFCAALAGDPMQVPVSAQLQDHAMFLTGCPANVFFSDPAALTEIMLLVTEYYCLDLPYLVWDVYNIEAEVLGQRLKHPPFTMPDIDQTDPLIRSERDLDKIKLNEPGKNGRMPMVLESYRLYEKYTGLVPMLQICGPFSLACGIRSYIGLINDIEKRPEFAHELMKRVCDDVLLPWIRVQHETVPQARVICAADAWGSLPNVDLRIFEEFVVPYLKRLDEAAQQFGIRVSGAGYWGESCLQQPQKLLETKAQISGCSPLGLLGLDPDVETLGPELFKDAAVKYDLPLVLGVNALLLNNGPVKAIIERMKRYIKAGAPEGRFAILLNNIPAHTPPRHIHAAVEAVRIYGKYPIKNDLDSQKVKIPPRESFQDFIQHKQADNPECYTWTWHGRGAERGAGAFPLPHFQIGAKHQPFRTDEADRPDPH
jgi:uroporphyrinogen-III decarboxylase